MRARNVGEMCAGEMGDRQGEDDAEKRWEEACRREEAIRDLLSRNPDGLKGRDVTDLAWELGLSRATAYRMIRLFRAGGTVTSPMDRTRGRREGFRTLDKEREEIIRQAIAGFYLKPTRPPFSKLYRQILVSCERAGHQPPNRRTIKARVEDVDLQTRGRRRGETEIVKATTPTPGDYCASRPLEIVQIDHTDPWNPDSVPPRRAVLRRRRAGH
jgi:putative transposase